jgi:hypothetical protein
MKDTYNFSEFGSFTRVRQIAVAMLFALTLAGPSRLWGQCQQGIQSLTISPGSITALAADPYGTANGTVTLNCPSLYVGTLVDISVSPPNGVLTCGPAAVAAGNQSGTFQCTAIQGSGAFTLSATLNGSTGTATLAVVPLEASMTVSPTEIQGGPGAEATVTVTTNAPVRSVSPYEGQTYYTVQNNCNNVSGVVYAQILPGNKQATASMGASAVTKDTPCTFTVTNYVWGGPTTSGAIMVTPASTPAVNPSNNGLCKQCLQQASHPVNVTNGNVWI